MAGRFLEILFTDPVKEAQRRQYGREQVLPPQPERDPLGQEEADFVAARDSFYLASVSPSGWPYIQHRGGERGFLRVLDPLTLAFADYRGNRQLLTTGHVSADARVSLFLMDYPRRERLKVLGRMRAVAPDADPELAARVIDPRMRGATERLFVIDIVSHDWNCPKHITPRFTAEEVAEAVAPLKDRIRELEASLAALRPR